MKNMKNAKKYLSVILALCLMLTSVPLAANFAFAADTSKYYTTSDGFRYHFLDDESIEITSYQGDVGVSGFLKYPSEIDGCKVLSIIFSLPNCKDTVSTVVIPEGVEAVSGQLSDFWAQRKRSLYLPSTLKYIGEQTFAYLDITYINQIPSSLEGIDKEAFLFTSFPRGYELELPDNLKYIGYCAFSDTQFASLKIGKNANFTERVLYTPHAGAYIWEEVNQDFNFKNPFSANCFLEKIEVDPENPYLTAVDNVLFSKDMHYLVAYHSGNYWGIDEPGPEFDYTVPEGVKMIVEGAFEDCDARHFTLSSTVEKIDSGAFLFLRAKSFVIPENSRLREIGAEALRGTRIGTELKLPSTLEIIGESAFKNSDFTAFNFAKSSKLTTIEESAFYNCDYITSFTVPNTVTTLGSGKSDPLYGHREPDSHIFRDCDSLEEIIFEDNSALVYTGKNSFGFCPKLRVLDFGENSALNEFCDWEVYNSALEIVDFSGCKNLEIINNGAFRNCKVLKTMDLRNTAMTQISSETFSGCTALESVYLPETLQNIKSQAFLNCTSLSKINTDNVRIIAEDAFTGCTLLNPADFEREEKITRDERFIYTEVGGEITITGVSPYDDETVLTFPDTIDSLPVTGIDLISHTANEQLIKEMYLPKKLKYIGASAFYNFIELETVHFPETLEHIGADAFLRYEGLNGVRTGKLKGEIYLPNIKTIGESAFYGCGFTKVEFGDSLLSIGESAFYGCPIKTVVLPDSMTSYGDRAFDNTFLEEITYGSKIADLNLIPDDYRHGESLTSLKSVTVSPENPNYYTDKGVLYNGDKTKLILYPQAKPDSEYNILPTTKTIGERAFFQASNLNAVTLPESLETLEVVSFGKSGLESIFIPASVKNLGDSVFSACENLKSVRVADGAIFGNMKFTFSNCTTLKAVEFGKNTTVETFDGTFANCPLESIVFPEKLTRIGDRAFMGSQFEALTVPETVTSLGAVAFADSTIREITLNSHIALIPSSCFNSCESLQKINLNFVTGIDGYAFKNCTSLTSIDLTNVRYSAPTAFEGCVNLTKFYFTDEDIKNAVVTEEEFRGNENLETIVVGNTVTKIGDYAFADCQKLESALIAPSVTEISDTAFENCDNLQITCMANSYAMTYAEENEIPYTTFVVAPIPDQEYTGLALEPELNVSAKGNTLTAECDYTAVYSDNINVGTAKVNVMGLGDYSIFASLVKFNIVDNEPAEIPVIPEAPEVPEIPENTEKSENRKDTVESEEKTNEAVVPVTPKAEDNNQYNSETAERPTENKKAPDGAKDAQTTPDGPESTAEATTSANGETNDNDEKEESFWSRIIALIVAFFTQIAVFFKSLFN